MGCHKISHLFNQQPFGGLSFRYISFDRGVRDIEISTVDGFQGQEKEVIVFSCVRAKNQSRSIG